VTRRVNTVRGVLAGDRETSDLSAETFHLSPETYDLGRDKQRNVSGDKSCLMRYFEIVNCVTLIMSLNDRETNQMSFELNDLSPGTYCMDGESNHISRETFDGSPETNVSVAGMKPLEERPK
jgi:hypothetical protein